MAYHDSDLAQWLQTILTRTDTKRRQVADQTAPSPLLGAHRPGFHRDSGDHDHQEGVSCELVAWVLSQCLTHPRFVAATQVSQRGVTCGRLAQLEGISRMHARLLLVWFDAAGILAAPRSEEVRWRAPRPFCSTDHAWLLDQVQATTMPAPETVQRLLMGS